MENIFDVNPEDVSLQAKSGGNFGLNKGSISKFEFNPNAGKDGAAQDAVDLDVKVGDREFRSRKYLSEEVYNNKNEKLKPGDEGYKEAYIAVYSQVIAVIKHALGALGVQAQAMSAATAGLNNGQLVEGIKRLVALAPANYNTIPVDVFLEYQWSIPEGKDRTYLQLPKNMKGGAFLCSSMAGSWQEVRGEDGSLSYVNGSGAKHLFTRDKNFMESNKAIPQGNVNGNQTTVTSTGGEVFQANPEAAGWGM